MKLRLSEPKTLIDIARIPGLSGISRKDGTIEIGAGTVHHDVATSSLLKDTCPMMAETAEAIGDPQVRNRGTLGGSLAHADPSADYPAAMLALDADIHIKGPHGPRVVKAHEFSAACSPSIWRRTRLSSASGSLRRSAPPTPSFDSARHTSPSSEWRPR
jgi:carbon-monoxide dehydrogenase medium subunit